MSFLAQQLSIEGTTQEIQGLTNQKADGHGALGSSASRVTLLPNTPVLQHVINMTPKGNTNRY